MQIDHLTPDHYRGALKVVSEGADAFVHVARISCSDGVVRRMFVKIYPDDHALLNEIVGYILASAGGFDVPERAAVIHVEPDHLPSTKPPWLKDREFGAWATMEIPNDSLKVYYHESIPEIRKELKESPYAAKIASFDQWVANNDRNMGNLLRMARGEYALIDHGRILGHTKWSRVPLDPTIQCHNKLCTVLEPHSQTLPFKSAMIHESKNRPSTFEQAEQSLTFWLDCAGPTARKNVLRFLSVRAENHEMLRKELGLVL